MRKKKRRNREHAIEEEFENVNPIEEEEEEEKRRFGCLFILGLILIFVGGGYLGIRYYSQFRSQNMYEELATVMQASVENDVGFDFMVEIAEQNPDLVGYIDLPDTSLSYPVVQTEKDDGLYYMRRDFAGYFSELGTPFADYRTPLSKTTEHIIIYGHTGDKGDYMFAPLLNYKDNSFFNTHQTVYLTTTTEVIPYRLLFALTVPADDYIAGLWLDTLDPHTREGEEIIKRLREASYNQISDYVYNQADRFLTLVSCERNRNNERVVVVYEQTNW